MLEARSSSPSAGSTPRRWRTVLRPLVRRMRSRGFGAAVEADVGLADGLAGEGRGPVDAFVGEGGEGGETGDARRCMVSRFAT